MNKTLTRLGKWLAPVLVALSLIGAPGTWRVKILARAEATATGGSGQAQVRPQPLVFVTAR